ncbi:DUF3800 domain-containing protein [Thermococcus sp.]
MGYVVEAGILVIDESGDLGIQDDSSKYFVIGGIYVSSSDENEVKRIAYTYIGNNTKGSQLACEELDSHLELLYEELKLSLSTEPVIVWSCIKKRVIKSFIKKHPEEFYVIMSSFIIDKLIAEGITISKVIFDYAKGHTEFTENALSLYYAKRGLKSIKFEDNRSTKVKTPDPGELFRYAHVKVVDLIANAYFKYKEKECYRVYNLTKRFWNSFEIYDSNTGRNNIVWKQYHEFRNNGIF